MKPIPTLALFALLAVLAATVLGMTAAGAAEKPLTFTKLGGYDPVHQTIGWTIAVTNANGSDSVEHTIQDNLPADFEWFLGQRNIDCSLDTADGVQVLHCPGFSVPGRVVDDNFDVIDGLSFVTVIAELEGKCGTWRNSSLLRNDRTTEVTPSNEAVLTVPCPATPTSTPPPATPTPSATATATETVSAATPTPTKTPLTFIPKPPNTGTGPLVENAAEGSQLAGKTTAFLLIAIGMGIFFTALSRKNRRR